MLIRHFPNRDHRRRGVTTLKCARARGPRFLTGSIATNKLTAATLRQNGYHRLFLPRTGRAKICDRFLECRARP